MRYVSRSSLAILAGLAVMTPSLAQSPADGLSARGVVNANASAVLSSEVAAKIESMPFKAGAAFRKGDELVRFDCSRYEAQLNGLEATVRKQQTLLSQKERLQKRQAAGAFEVEDARADLLRASADVKAMEAEMRGCVIAAPYDGRVVEKVANAHESPAPNAPLMKILDDGSLEIDLIVPSTWLKWLKPGSEFRFAIEETGEVHDAKIVRLGAQIDAVSQTIKVTGAFSDNLNSIVPGMSGTGTFSAPEM